MCSSVREGIAIKLTPLLSLVRLFIVTVLEILERKPFLVAVPDLRCRPLPGDLICANRVRPRGCSTSLFRRG